MSNVDSLKKFMKKNPVSSSEELQAVLGSRVLVAKAVRDALIAKVGSGYYSASDVNPEEAQLLVVAKYFPRAVISGVSSLAFHHLTDERPNRVSVDIERSSSLRNNILEVHRVMSKFISGVDQIKIRGVTIRIYDMERTLCDLYKKERSSAVFLKALKRYVKSQKINSKKIAQYDELLKTKVLEHLKQELADG